MDCNHFFSLSYYNGMMVIFQDNKSSLELLRVYSGNFMSYEPNGVSFNLQYQFGFSSLQRSYFKIM